VPQPIVSVTPSASGVPNSVALLGNYEFVSVQRTGQIFTYNVASGTPVAVNPPYATPCKDPSGMAIASVAGTNVMAVVCYDTGSLLTLAIASDGTLSGLGSVGGLGVPYPGVALDGTNVLVPLYGQSQAANGGVAKVSIAEPANPVVTGVATLSSPGPGEYANPGYLAVWGGYIFLAAGSESAPIASSSTIQAVDEATMTVVGQPLSVAHSPQQIVVAGGVAYVTFYDATQLEAIDVSKPGALIPMQTVPLGSASASCHPIPVAVSDSFVYVGCYDEATIVRFDTQTLANAQSITAITTPQRILVSAGGLVVPSSTSGGMVYQIDPSVF
jgi:hypothetical protein